MATSSFKASNLRRSTDESQSWERFKVWGELLLAHLPEQLSIEAFLAKMASRKPGKPRPKLQSASHAQVGPRRPAP